MAPIPSYGQVTNIWGDTQYPVELDYDQYGQQTTMRTFRTGTGWAGTAWPTDITGDLTTWTYDPASGLVTAKTDAASHSATYSYAVDGKLTTRTWARGITTNYSYAPATGELLQVDYSDNTPISLMPITVWENSPRFRMPPGQGFLHIMIHST